MPKRFRVVLWVLLALVWVSAVQAAPAFPVKYSTDQRTLVDRNGMPFPILGRTAWFVVSLPVTDYRTFVDDTVSRGYTAIELHVVNHDPRGNQPPFNGNGDAPFLKRLSGSTWSGLLSYGNINTDAPDFTTPNEAYWSFVDEFLSYCESKGILVFIFPAYVGFQGGNQGWMQEMVANGPVKMQSYGAWIAARYKNQKNLVWMMGGDFGTPPNNFSQAQTDVESGLLTGLKSVPGQQSSQFSAEWNFESIATDQALFGASMTLNGVYSIAGDVTIHGRRAYSDSPTEPAYLLEEPYDQEGSDGTNVNVNATQPVRRYQWWGWLSTIGGYISGNGYVWPFNPGWQSHFNTQGAQDMARLNAFVRTIPWYNLIPSGLSGMRTIITSGGSNSNVSSSEYVAAAATPTGTLMVAYVPPDHAGPFTVDMAVMAGPTRARWFDPTSGAYINIGGGLANTGSISFTTPGNNSAGDKDWVLVLQTVTEPNDIDGDGKSDILWRQTSTGTTSVWLMNAGNVQSYAGGWIVPGDWVIQAVGDFDGDGRADILWRQTSTGAVVIWLMDGGTIKSFAGGWIVSSDWMIQQVGDFNGDRKTDILWRQTGSGVVSIWLMNGGTIQSYAGGWPVTPDWVIQQVGDFNGDGKADILWRRTDGVVSIWLMNGGTIQSYAGGWTVSSDWVIQQVGDFNGDGKADVLWRQTGTGLVSIWLMNGGTIQSYAGGWPVTPDWVIQQVGDFNGDGKADILWRRTDGVVSIWLMSDGNIQSYAGGWAVPGDWGIQR